MEEIWSIEERFIGRRVFILGNGPSLKEEDIGKLYYRYADTTIAINDSAKLAPWAGYLFFRDLDWFRENRGFVFDWEGEVITPNSSAARSLHTIKRIISNHVADFTSAGNGSIKYGRTSGHLALSLAITMGALEVVLLGFDCRVVDGRSHWNNFNNQVSAILYEKDFLLYWKGWGRLTNKAGVRVFNITPGSAIKEFEFCDLDNLL